MRKVGFSGWTWPLWSARFVVAGLLVGHLGAVDLSTTLHLSVDVADAVPVQFRWMVKTKAPGSGDPQVSSFMSTMTGSSAEAPVMLPQAQPGTYEFQAEVMANGLTVVSEPVRILVVRQVGTPDVRLEPAADSGSGGGCGTGSGVAVVILLALTGLARAPKRA